MTVRNHLNEERVFASNEAGFTIIELLVTSLITSILAGIALVGFSIYKDNAEYAKAESDLRNARTAAEVGLQEFDGSSQPISFSTTTGGPVTGVLSSVLPGAVVSPDIALGAEIDDCSSGSGFEQHVVARACKAELYTSWARFCNGVEVTQSQVSLPGGC